MSRTPSRMSRRTFVRGAAATVVVGAASIGALKFTRREPQPWDDRAFAPPGQPLVSVVRASSYERDLEGLVQDGLGSVGADVKGRSVVIKPNFVEYDDGTSINTNPALIAATVLALRRMGATAVTVAEGSGHRRDADYVVSQSGLWDALSAVEVPFVDLNVAPVREVPLRSSYMEPPSLWLPQPGQLGRDPPRGRGPRGDGAVLRPPPRVGAPALRLDGRAGLARQQGRLSRRAAARR